MTNLQSADKTGTGLDYEVYPTRQLTLQRMSFDQTTNGSWFGRPRSIQAYQKIDQTTSELANKEVKGSFASPAIGSSKENGSLANINIKRHVATRAIELKKLKQEQQRQIVSIPEGRRLSFSLRPFNSVRLGPKPTIRKERGKAQTVYFLQATKPVVREMKLNGLTLRVKVTAN